VTARSWESLMGVSDSRTTQAGNGVSFGRRRFFAQKPPPPDQEGRKPGTMTGVHPIRRG
jgi:hypothetical protein